MNVSYISFRMFLLAGLGCFGAGLSLQAQKVEWDKTFGGKHAEYLMDVQPTADYGFIIAGSSLSGKNGNKSTPNQGDLDFWLWKIDEHGSPVWQKSFGGSETDHLHCLKLTRDGGFILGGSSNSHAGGDKKEDSRGQEDFWVIKLDAAGHEQWQKTLGGVSSDVLKHILLTSDGGYLLAGHSYSEANGDKKTPSYGHQDIWLVKLDAQGHEQWQKTYGGSHQDVLQSIALTYDGGFILGATSNSPESGNKQTAQHGLGDYWVLKLDKQGESVWQYTYGGDKDEELSFVHPTRDGHYLIGGSSLSGATHNKSKTNKTGADIWLIKVNELGHILWQETYSMSTTDRVVSVIEQENGHFLLGCYTATRQGPKKDTNEWADAYVAIRIKNDGEELWRKKVGTHGVNILNKVIETRDGGYVFAGSSKGQAKGPKSTTQGGFDFWLVKLLDPDKPVKEKELVEAIPNPARDYTNVVVGFDFQEATLTVFDLAGRTITSYKIEDRTVPVSMGNLPEGIYIIEVRSKEHQGSVKVIKSKR